MQTFLPYPDFLKSAMYLDDKRLRKQRVEGLQILRALIKGPKYCPICFDYTGIVCYRPNMHARKKTGWYNHPAVQMWKGHEGSLARYIVAVCEEWKRRDFRDTIRDELEHYFPWSRWTEEQNKFPSWFGREDFHKSHRSNLLRKNFPHYSKYFIEPTNLPYVWPSKEIKEENK